MARLSTQTRKVTAMKKIPTLFERDRESVGNRVIPVINPVCDWVARGEGIATRKIDGSCCMIREGLLYKRFETKKVAPPDFEEVAFDEVTGKRFGWRPVSDAPEDKWHRAALANCLDLPDGTYELIGPKVQGNPEGVDSYALVPHTVENLAFKEPPPRDFDGLRSWLEDKDVEGIVFHHPDGRMAKIKGRDFGLKREKNNEDQPSDYRF